MKFINTRRNPERSKHGIGGGEINENKNLRKTSGNTQTKNNGGRNRLIDERRVFKVATCCKSCLSQITMNSSDRYSTFVVTTITRQRWNTIQAISATKCSGRSCQILSTCTCCAPIVRSQSAKYVSTSKHTHFPKINHNDNMFPEFRKNRD